MIWYSRDENGVETPLTVSGGQTIQVNEMPAASADYVGIVCQYIGATTANYTHNYFYECVEDISTNPTTYSWVQTNVQASENNVVQPDWNQTDNAADDYIKNKPTIPEAIQYSTMPTAKAALVGQIVQFTGATQLSGYKNGHWYRCEETAVSGTYTWKDLYVDTAIMNDDRAITSNGVYSALQSKQDLIEITNAFDLDYRTSVGDIIIWNGDETYFTKGRLYKVILDQYENKTLQEVSTLTSTEATKLNDLADIKSIGNGLILNNSTGELTATNNNSDTTPRWRKSKSVNGVKIVTFADGTYDELIAMVNAHKAHTINIYEYWHVGDSRRIRINAHTDFSGRTIPAQYVNATIVNPYYATDEDVLFVIKIGSGLWNQYPIDTTGNELVNGFGNSQLRNYLNGVFYLALEQGLKNLTSIFTTKNIVDSTSAVKTDIVHVTLPSITEFGFTSGSLYTKETAAGIKPFEYYYDSVFRMYYAVEDNAPNYWIILSNNKSMWSRSFYNSTNGQYVYNNGSSDSYNSVSEPCVIIPIMAIK